jgi:acyl-CoA synthetase (NDP forming)
MGRHGVPEAVASLRERRFPSYAFPESAAAALARAARYGAWLAAPEGALPSVPVDRAAAASVLARSSSPRWLPQQEVHALFAAYGIPTLGLTEATSADEAASAAERLGFPVAMKLASDTILHKTDVGGVLLDLASPQEVRDAFSRIEGRLTALGRRQEMRGVSLQRMAPRGVELFIGATRDVTYGHLIGFGIGGVQVELWKDIVFRVAPLRDTEARGMIDQIRGRALLDGFRGGPSVDRDRITELLLRVSQMVTEHPSICELDINPLCASAAEILAVDARVRVVSSS